MSYFRRKLWFADQDGQHQLQQDDLLIRREPIVVLGEPGMGKTELLKELGAKDGNAFCRAHKLVNRVRPETLLGSNRRLVVDALDEVSAQSDGDAVDLVLRKLGELGYPPFILSCRAGEWRAAISSQAIADQYDDVPPLEVHLEPLGEDEQYELLSQLTGDAKRAQTLLDHFVRFGLDFLGNPQTLELVAAMPIDRPLPATSGALFEDAIETLRKERNPQKDELPHDEVLDAAGAAFSALILSGNARITDQPSGTIDPADKALPLAEVEAFGNGHVKLAANTKLFATDLDGLTYAHRRIGEFIGARWLAARADTRAKRQRLLQQFQSYGLVPASLRGIHAWLVRDPHLACGVIDADPMGVVEYADAEALTPEQAWQLFSALERHAVANPRFSGWHEHRAAALVTPPLMDEVARVIGDRESEFGLRLLLLQQLKGATTAEGQRPLLRERMLDDTEPYGIRYASALVLIALGGENWPVLLEELRRQVRKGSLRLAHELLDDIGVDMFSDEQIVAIVLARDGLSVSPIEADSEGTTVFGFYRLANHVPVERLDGLLDLFASHASMLLPDHAGIEENDLIDLQYALILKRIKNGDSIDPLRLWQWLKPFDAQDSYRREQGKEIGAWLKANPKVRLSIQQHVLIDKVDDKNIWQRAWPLQRGIIDLYPTHAEIVSLLQTIDPDNHNEAHWREIVALGRVWGEEGKPLCKAIKSLVQHRPDLLTWIDGLADRKVPEWELEHEEKKRKRQEQKEAEIAEHRRNFHANIEEVRSGQYGRILPPARAYLNHFRDISDDLSAHDRVADWLGEEIAAAALEGFEAFLQASPPRPSAKEIALSYAQSKLWPAVYIIVSALAERVRTRSKPFEGVSSERLAAGLFECWHGPIADHAGLEELAPKIEAELKWRGRWEQVVRLYIQPQLRLGRQHVDHLWAFMSSKDGGFGADLAQDWLLHYPAMSDEAEVEMIDRLLRSNRRDALRVLVAARQEREIGEERRRNWQAVALIVDFDAVRERLGDTIKPELLWHLRDRAGHGRRDEGTGTLLSVDQLAWMITTFREQWPEVSRPSGVTTGDVNPWDASEYIRTLITRLASDVSAEAVAALTALRDAPEDSYTWMLRTVSFEQRQKQANEDYKPPTLDKIKMVLDGGPPGSVADLRAIVVEELRELGKRLCGSSEDEIDFFWTDDGLPRTENECRDRTVSLLRGHLEPLSLYPANEADMPQDKRADIVFYHGGLLLPLEAKRHQHRDLWNAIDGQLEALYTGHWQAEGQGLFLVFWFGSDYQVPAPPSGGAKPTSAVELQNELDQHSAVKAGRVEVVVLDLSR
ncbi:hypothetical protein SAMN05661010_01513 [Modicisalibacter muralis]|uniref:Uncharacterized protein n=1 Tax=Modicisalibacter muralis TaxID=119000 RepID=A0A1G9JLH2_9GAMM|nr:hypothetical protein [Halomonas muralis]SDL38152.1 hypothetical protein SAMN05661010_01513 [Halomonas muralis]